MARNILRPRKRRCFELGGDLTGKNGTDINWTNAGNPLKSSSQMPTRPAMSAPKAPAAGVDAGGAIGGGMQLIQASAEGAATGANNLNELRKAEGRASIDAAKDNTRAAEDVSRSYSAGQQANYMTRNIIKPKTARELKDHKGWKNVLKTAGAGAAAGATIGSAVPVIGTAIGAAAGATIGAAAAGIGELIGWRKRKKEAERQKREAEEAARRQDFAIDYYNRKQNEQLLSANDNAAKVQADQNRTGVLALAARGGKMHRKNYLLTNKNKLC